MAFAHSLGAGAMPDNTCTFNRDDGSGSRRDFFVGCPNALAASQACYVTDRWFTPHFSVLARFRIDAWMVDVSCPVACQPLWLACWLDTPDRSSSSSSRIVQDVWDVYRDVLGVVPDEVVCALRDAASRSSVDDFCLFGVKMRRLVYFGLMLLLGVLLLLEALSFFGEVSYVFVGGVLEVKLLVVGALAGCLVFLRVMRLIVTVPSFLSTLLFLQYYSFVDVLILSLMFLRVFGVKDLPSLDGILWLGIGGAVCRHGPCGPNSSLHPWDDWLPPDLHGFYRWVFDSIEVLNGFLRQVVVSRRDEGIRRWKGWLRENLSSRPYIWLRPDFVSLLLLS